MRAQSGHPLLRRAALAGGRPRRKRPAPAGNHDCVTGHARIPGAGLHPPVQDPVEEERTGRRQIQTAGEPIRGFRISAQQSDGGGDVACVPPESLCAEVARGAGLRDPAHTVRKRFPVTLDLADRNGEAIGRMHPPPELLPAPAPCARSGPRRRLRRGADRMRAAGRAR